MSGVRNAKSHDFEMVPMPATPGAKKADDVDSMAHRRKLLIDNLADEASIGVSSPDITNRTNRINSA
jgi:hypothetical protein